MKEIWKDIKGYEGFYQVSNKGNVKSLERIIRRKHNKSKEIKIKERILKPYLYKRRRSNSCTPTVALSVNGKLKTHSVHRLVAETFLSNGVNVSKLEVNHIDGNSENNCVENLEFITKKENIRHAFNNKLIKSEKPVLMYDMDWNLVREFKSLSEAGRYVGCGSSHLSRAITKRNGIAYNHYWKFK